MPVTTRRAASAIAGETAPNTNPRLPWWARIYAYGLHGVVVEVLYTAVWEVMRLNLKAIGVSSVWSLFIYGFCLFGIEQLYARLTYRFNFVIRGIIYALWIYAIELACGITLEMFDAKNWDYKLFKFHFGGFITLEYAPMWFVFGLITELILVKLVLNTTWSPMPDDHRHHGLAAGEVAIQRRHFAIIVPAVVALIAYVYYFLAAAYNNGEYLQKQEL